jgi:hypothetical protein
MVTIKKKSNSEIAKFPKKSTKIDHFNTLLLTSYTVYIRTRSTTGTTKKKLHSNAMNREQY